MVTRQGMRRAVSAICGATLGLPVSWAAALPSWQPAGHGLSEHSLRIVVADPAGQQLYASSAKTAYRSTDGGQQWERTFRAPGAAEITAVALDPFNHQQALITTSGGLYRTTDGGRHWGRVFGGAGLGASACDSPLFHPTRAQIAFAGTSTRLLLSQDGGGRWEAQDLPPGAGAVHALAVHPAAPHQVYVMAEHELFEFSTEHHQWRSLFRLSASHEESAEDVEEAPEEPEDLGIALYLTSLAIDAQEAKHLFLGSSKGVYESQDGGATWHVLPQAGLETPYINHLILQPSPAPAAYVATPRGVARYRPDDERWEILYSGLPTLGAYHLSATNQDIFAATDAGLYSLNLVGEQLAQGRWPSTRDVLGGFAPEPAIGEVQQAAIAYGEVQPEKIQRWRRQARWRAFIPTLSIGADTDLADLRVWDDHGVNGEDTLLKGERDIDWSASVKWELADLVWSTNQTSIDVRSKLMVQLRDDILDQVTRTYFERRRLQVQLMTERPADPKSQIEKELRVQELTALLDGLTGGWFSEELERRQAF